MWVLAKYLATFLTLPVWTRQIIWPDNVKGRRIHSCLDQMLKKLINRLMLTSTDLCGGYPGSYQLVQ